MQIVSKGLTFAYNPKTPFSKTAVKNVNLTINDGDFFGIIGHTGSGKSTFIQHLNGLIKVQEGELLVGDFNLSANVKVKPQDLKNLRSQIGMVFQYPEYQLFAETVFEDVAFALKNFEPNLTEQEVKERVKNALTMVGLEYNAVCDKSPFDLSGGQKRRIAIAGVLVSKPKVLVLDEPVAGLDPVGKRELLKILHDLHHNGVQTIVIVSHDIDEVFENCNRVAVFDGGECVKCATCREIFQNSEFLKTHLIDEPLNVEISNLLKKLSVEVGAFASGEELVEEISKKYFEKME